MCVYVLCNLPLWPRFVCDWAHAGFIILVFGPWFVTTHVYALVCYACVLPLFVYALRRGVCVCVL